MRVVIASPLCRFRKQLDELEEAHMLRGQLKASQQHALLSSHDDLAQALEGAFFVQVNDDVSSTTDVSVLSKSLNELRNRDTIHRILNRFNSAMIFLSTVFWKCGDTVYPIGGAVPLVKVVSRRFR